MAVVHVRAGLACHPDDFLGAVDDRVGDHLDQVPGVREGRHARLHGQLGDPHVFRRVDGRRVAEQQADAERPVGQVAGQAGEESGELRGRGRALPGGVPEAAQDLGQRAARREPGDLGHPGLCPRGGEAVVDRPPLGRDRPVGGRHRAGSRLQLQRGRDPVQRLQAQSGQVADVAVEVDESRRHHQTRGVHLGARSGQAGTDLRDPARSDGDVGDGVEPGLRIDHAAAAQHDLRFGHPPAPLQRGQV